MHGKIRKKEEGTVHCLYGLVGLSTCKRGQIPCPGEGFRGVCLKVDSSVEIHSSLESNVYNRGPESSVSFILWLLCFNASN